MVRMPPRSLIKIMPNTKSSQNDTSSTRHQASGLMAWASAGVHPETRGRFRTISSLRGVMKGAFVAGLTTLLMSAGSVPLQAAVQTWTNNTATNYLSNSPGLWQGATNPNSNDSWVFANTANETLTNNFTNGFYVSGITFSAGTGTTTLNGNSINLIGSIVNNSSSLQTIGFGLSLVQSTPQTITTAANGGNLLFTNTISGSAGSGGLTFNGSGTSTLVGSNSFMGGALISSGTVVVTNSYGLGVGTTTVLGGTLIASSTNNATNTVAVTG